MAGGQRIESVQLSGSGVGWDEFTMGEFSGGHNFLAVDERASRPVVVVSTSVADALFGDLDPLGRTVRIRGTPFRVIGTFEPSANIFGEAAQNFVVVPYTAALKYLGANPHWMSVLVVPADNVTQDAAIDRVIATMRAIRGLRPGDPQNFAIIKQEELADRLDRKSVV